MRSRYYARETERTHFVTSTILNWLPVFNYPECCETLVQSLEYCRREKGLRLYAWVIMDNHFHAVVQADEISRVMTDLKKFTAHRLLGQLKERSCDWLLKLLTLGKVAHKQCSRHQVWQEGFHPQAIYSDKTMLQKIDYIHANPVRRGWVAAPEHWRHSSAHEGLPGAMPLIRCDQWM
jgi:REP element-mobilizing transposase RayT